MNEKNNIKPKTIKKNIKDLLENIKIQEKNDNKNKFEKSNLKIHLKDLRKEMYKEAEALNFEKAAQIRDEILTLEKNELKL